MIRRRKSLRWVSWALSYLAVTAICSTAAGLVIVSARGQVVTAFDKVSAAFVGRF